MSAKVTLADVKASRIPAACGVCADDTRILQWLNEAQERLLTKGNWFNTLGKFRICVDDGRVTIPPQLATIERAAICGRPIKMRDMLYEFLDSGYGLRSACPNTSNSGSTCCCAVGSPSFSCAGGAEGIYRGAFPTVRDILSGTALNPKKVNLICDLATDVGKTALVLGYDGNGNWIRTDQSGTIKDGELIAFAQSAGTTSTSIFSSITDIQLPSNMDGQSWIYEYDTVATTKRLLSKYEYFETRPSYARYFFTSVCQNTATDGSCTQMALDIIGKLEHIPVKVDTDYCVIASIPALKAMMVAIRNAEMEPDATKKVVVINAGYAEAKAELDSQLAHYMGEPVRGVNIMDSSLGTVDPVPTLL